MSQDLPYMSYVAFYMISLHIIQTNSKTSTHWKLNMEIGKVQSATNIGSDTKGFGDPVMDILMSKASNSNGNWEVLAADSCDQESDQEENTTDILKPDKYDSVRTDTRQENNTTKKNKESKKEKTKENGLKGAGKTKKKNKSSFLDCGSPVNNTEYDSLRGILHRNSHPSIPEPEVAMIFRKKSGKGADVDMNELESKLRRAKKEKPNSAHVYNQIGNFWRIKGNTQMSVECFRKALFINPQNPDVLLNLARVLFNLQYLDDAIYLTRRSLEMLPPEQNSWLQHFTLGEILKAYGHYQEATLHFKRTLDLNPNFQPAGAHLREMEMSPNTSVTYYTLFIILMLVLIVLCGILTSMDGLFEDLGENTKTQRHFNRAMAMRSIKLGINPKLIKMRKQMAQAYN